MAHDWLLNAPVTQELLRLGFLADYLRTVHLREGADVPFALWPIRSIGTPIRFDDSEVVHRNDTHLLYLLKVYATRKWLEMEDRSWSPNRDAAYEFLNATYAAHQSERGRKWSRAQSERAKKPRGKLSEGGETAREVIERIVMRNPDGDWLTHWRSFISDLDGRGLHPREDKSDDKNRRVTYECGPNSNHMESRRFKNIISDVRKKGSR